jgi:hypothetical protein
MVLIVQVAQAALPLLHIRVGVAVTLIALGVYKLIRRRHFRCGGVACLREVRPGNASPFFVQSGPDLGDGTGGNWARSVTDWRINQLR